MSAHTSLLSRCSNVAAKRSLVWPAVSVLVAALVVLIALPDTTKSWAPYFIRSATFHFGLDLAGGTQLDFRISEREMQEQLEALQAEVEHLKAVDADPQAIVAAELQAQSISDQKQNIVESIRTVLERRINALGVSEAIITPSYVGGEKHLLVECPGVIDTQECIENVGKTIKLEFKEELTEPTEEYEEEVRDHVKEVRKQLDDPENGDENGFDKGYLMAYYQIFSTMQDQAVLFDIDQKACNLSIIDPDRDLLPSLLKEKK